MAPKGIGYLIKAVNDKLKIHADADLKEHRLTLTQSRVLAYLNSRGGQATQKEIEDFLNVSHPTVVGIVSRMEQKGHVTTWMEPKVQRSKMVCLTSEARSIGDDMSRMIQQDEAAMLRGLTEEQAVQLEESLQIILSNLN